MGTRTRTAVRILLALIIAGSTAVLGSPARAHNVSWETRIDARFSENDSGTDLFAGEVFSDSGEACEDRRTVKVYRVHRVRRNGRLVRRDVLTGTATTAYDPSSSSGRWRVDVEDPRDGRYYAKVTAEDLDPSREHAHTCRAGTTAKFAVDDNPDEESSPTNDAPVLDASKSPALDAQSEDAPAPSGAVGTLVSSLVDLNPPAGGLDNVSDVDASPVTGMAVTAADTDGTWWYTLDAGSTWQLLGPVSTASARLLPASSAVRLYFQPNANFTGSATITFRAWDRTSGTSGATANTATTGGSTAFSVASDTASVTV